jgi:BirA family biotin operon repressor/biotin-[acetyl-CoA-carboxylase] ligase
MTFGTPRFYYERTASTQDVAREMARVGAVPGTTIVAGEMKSGRGRRGRIWSAPAGAGLWLTVIGELIDPARLWELAFVVGVGVAHGLKRVAPAVPSRLRFPNDLTVEGRKLGGVLIEAVLREGRATPLIGIGINVTARAWPEELAGRATSLEDSGSAPGLDVLEAAILLGLDEAWSLWKSDGLAELLPEWESRRDALAEREFVRDGTPVRCRVTGLEPDGTVRLLAADGAEWSARAPEVVLGED